MSALFPPANALAAGLAILAIGIAAIPFQAQFLFLFWMLNSAHDFSVYVQYVTRRHQVKIAPLQRSALV